MDWESKLDEDFLFYLGFTSSLRRKIKDCGDKALAQQWLQKLCGETCVTMEQKRNRNIFLSNLLLNIQEKKLSGPFALSPQEVDFSDPSKYFSELASQIEKPSWLSDEILAPDFDEPREDGRTYVATRVMPDNEGAFAYIALSLGEQEPRWLGGGEGVFDQMMEEKFKEMVPERNEMEVILARRKDPKERQRVLTFYDAMMQNIADELDEKITPDENQQISGLIQQLIQDMQRRGEYEDYENLDPRERRIELLLLLFDRASNRRRKVATREEYLDSIDKSLKASFFEASAVPDDQKYEWPSAMWEYCINRPPGKKNLEKLKHTYPAFLVEKFMELVSNNKEEIAMRMQRRHTRIVTQMKVELQKEGDKLKKWVNEARSANEQSELVLKAVKEAYEKQKESESKAGQRKKGGYTRKSHLYEEMRAALKDTQIDVEEEAERGRVLTEQINAVNAQTEIYNQITECSIINTEEANMAVMKNIKRLMAAVKTNEARLMQIQQMKQVSSQRSKQGEVFIF